MIFTPFVLLFLAIFSPMLSTKYRATTNGLMHQIREYERENEVIVRNAGHIICVAAPRKELLVMDDCIAAQHYMMLHTKTVGIESFIAGQACVR